MKQFRAEHAQGGFALVAAIFLVVVVAMLGAFAVRTTMTQQSTVDTALLDARVEAAVDAGIELAASRLQAVRNCGTLSTPFVVEGFTVSYGPCQQQLPSPTVGGVAADIFTIPVTATQGVYGSPEFVSRTRVVSISF